MKNRKRDDRKQAIRRQAEQTRIDRKHCLERVVAALGWFKVFRDLPRDVRELAVNRLPGPPAVVAPAELQKDPAIRYLKGRIESALVQVAVVMPDGTRTALADLLSVGCPLPAGFASIARMRLPKSQRAVAAKAAKATTAFLLERLPGAFAELDKAVNLPLMAVSRMDGSVFGFHLTDPNGRRGRPVCRFVLERTEPQPDRVVIDGKARPAYPCTIPWHLNGTRQMTIAGAALGLKANHEYPVFLQGHALRRLRERLSPSRIPEVAIHFGLISSLADVVVAERASDKYLLAFHLNGTRVGYLAARLLPDKVVVTTFLFLTMEGTPEFRLLREKLRLTRPDIEFVGLDRLETFLADDVNADPELVRVLEECGCRPLLDLARGRFPHVDVGDRAVDLRRFLILPKADGRALAGRFLPPKSRVA
jgi:hypothetical protein